MFVWLEYPIVEFKQNIVLIAYPSTFNSKDFLESKCNKILDAFNDFLIIGLDDSNGLIKAVYEDHLLEIKPTADISDKEVKLILSGITHVIIFWDGEEYTKFVYQSLLSKIPYKIVPVETTRVCNKDRGDPFDVYIGRKSPWGNPFIIGKDGDRDEVIGKFRKYFYESVLNDPKKSKSILSLKGKRLGCHCKPYACHGDVIAEYLNNINNS